MMGQFEREKNRVLSWRKDAVVGRTRRWRTFRRRGMISSGYLSTKKSSIGINRLLIRSKVSTPTLKFTSSSLKDRQQSVRQSEKLNPTQSSLQILHYQPKTLIYSKAIRAFKLFRVSKKTKSLLFNSQKKYILITLLQSYPTQLLMKKCQFWERTKRRRWMFFGTLLRIIMFRKKMADRFRIRLITGLLFCLSKIMGPIPSIRMLFIQIH